MGVGVLVSERKRLTVVCNPDWFREFHELRITEYKLEVVRDEGDKRRTRSASRPNEVTRRDDRH